ncbi:hypothetical protein [Streptomyces sp. NPDC001492]
MVRLYAVPVSRTVELTTDRFHRDENGAYLTLDRHPVLLPPKPALLIKEQIPRPVTDSRMLQQFGLGGPDFTDHTPRLVITAGPEDQPSADA